MKHIQFYLLPLMVAAFQFNSSAQSSKRFELESFSVQAGLMTEAISSTTANDFKSLAPESNLLKTDFTGFSNTTEMEHYNFNGMSSFWDEFNNNFRNSPSLNIAIGMKINKKNGTQKFNKLLRLGIGLYSGNGMNINIYKNDRETFETFTSAQTNQTVFLDSVNTRFYSMNYMTQQIRLDASMIFKSKTGKRCTLYTGFGINGGVSINSETRIYNSNKSFTDARIGSEAVNDDELDLGSDKGTTETFKNKTQTAFSAYIPLGVEKSLSKKRDLLKHINLFYELRPGINVSMSPEISTQSNFSLHHGLGIRYTINSGS